MQPHNVHGTLYQKAVPSLIAGLLAETVARMGLKSKRTLQKCWCRLGFNLGVLLAPGNPWYMGCKVKISLVDACLPSIARHNKSKIL